MDLIEEAVQQASHRKQVRFAEVDGNRVEVLFQSYSPTESIIQVSIGGGLYWDSNGNLRVSGDDLSRHEFDRFVEAEEEFKSLCDEYEFYNKVLTRWMVEEISRSECFELPEEDYSRENLKEELR